MANNRDDMDLNDELDNELDHDEFEIDEEELTSSWHEMDDDVDDEIDNSDYVTDEVDDEAVLNTSSSDEQEESATPDEDVKPAQNPMPLIAGAAVVFAGALGGGYYLMNQGESSAPMPMQSTQVANNPQTGNPQVPKLGDPAAMEAAIADTNKPVKAPTSKTSVDETMKAIEELKDKVIALEKHNAALEERIAAQKAQHDKAHRQFAQQLKDAQATNKQQDSAVTALSERVSALEEQLQSAITEAEREAEIAQRASEQGINLKAVEASDRWTLERKVDMTEHEHDSVASVTGDRWRMKGYQIVSWNDAGDKVLMRTSTGKTFTFKVGEHINSPVYGVHKVTAIEEGGKRMLVGDKYVVDTTYVKLPGATLYGAIPAERAAMKAAGYDSPESYITSKAKAEKAPEKPVIKEEIVKGFVAVGIGPNGVIVRTEQSDQPFILVKHGTDIKGFGVVTRVEKDGTIKSGNKVIESNIK